LWFRVAYPAYAVGLALLVLVHVMGTTGMGAQRWLEVGPLQLQPSELMKIAMVLVLARYFHGLNPEKIGNPLYLPWPLVLLVVPAALILKQPKLGTTVLMLLTAAAMFFCAGVRIWKFVAVGLAAAGALPLAWSFLRDYQKQRVMSFLDPESDPLGAGYHIIQSKIALGSGGLWGKGFLNGTQGHLQFLPERQTDFIFSMLSEEFGLVGGLVLIGLYTAILLYGLGIALRARSQFARLVAIGISTAFFANAFVNLAMVMGLLPVVGEPLPFLSYGGTAMITLLIGFGLVMNSLVYADTVVGPHTTS
jgi:rod shape determining protein RodA